MKVTQIFLAMTLCLVAFTSGEEIVTAPVEPFPAAITTPVEVAPAPESNPVPSSPVSSVQSTPAQVVEQAFPVPSPAAATPAVQSPAPQVVQQVVSKPAVAAPVPAKYPDLSGVTTHTKNPDGSTLTVTHFKGQVPQSAIFQPLGGFPTWGNPTVPFFYPWSGYSNYGPVNHVGIHSSAVYPTVIKG